MKALTLSVVFVLAASGPVLAQDDMTSVRSCTDAMNRSPQMVSMYGSEGVVDICKCAVPMIAAKYPVTDQVRLNALPKTRGSVFASRDTEFQAYIGLQTDAGAKCARNVSDPGWEEREARELAERDSKRRADSARWAAESATEMAKRAERASSPDALLRTSLRRIAELQPLYLNREGDGDCKYLRDRLKDAKCGIYFASLAELQAGWGQMSRVQRLKPWPGEEYFQPAGVNLQFEVTRTGWTVTATLRFNVHSVFDIRPPRSDTAGNLQVAGQVVEAIGGQLLPERVDVLEHIAGPVNMPPPDANAR